MTNYSRGEAVGKRVPRTLQVKVGNLALVVTRSIDYPNSWIARLNPGVINECDLKTDDVEKAKKRALNLAAQEINRSVQSMNEALKVINDLIDGGKAENQEGLQ